MLERYVLVNLLVFYIVSGLVIFRSFHKHLLVTLLRLEYVILNVFFTLIIRIRWERSEGNLALVFLIFAVSEGRIGLSMIVRIVRRHGRDSLKRINLLCY